MLSSSAFVMEQLLQEVILTPPYTIICPDEILILTIDEFIDEMTVPLIVTVDALIFVTAVTFVALELLEVAFQTNSWTVG